MYIEGVGDPFDTNASLEENDDAGGLDDSRVKSVLKATPADSDSLPGPDLDFGARRLL